MATNICKEKGCSKEIPASEKYCSYHKKKRDEAKGTIVKGVLGFGAASVGLVALIKGKIKPKA